jgi:NDP-sugar pyrophosphorylase family protein
MNVVLFGHVCWPNRFNSMCVYTIGHKCILRACTIENQVLIGMGSILEEGSYVVRFSFGCLFVCLFVRQHSMFAF